MGVKNILLLGDERLYNVCVPIDKYNLETAEKVLADLKDTMSDFKKTYGFGRAIASPQIGAMHRIIYLNTGDMEIGFINPELHFPQDERFELWDD